MKILLAAVLCLFCSADVRALAKPASVAPAEPSEPEVPPLSDAQLTPAERDRLGELTEPEEKVRFRITRAYVRLCAAVTQDNAASLPPRPTQYNREYVSAAESALVNKAIRMAIGAILLRPTASA